MPHSNTPMPDALASGFPVLVVGRPRRRGLRGRAQRRGDPRGARSARTSGRRHALARRRRGRRRVRTRRSPAWCSAGGSRPRATRRSRRRSGSSQRIRAAGGVPAGADRREPRRHPPGAARDRRAGRGLHLGSRGQPRLHRRAHRRGGAPLSRHRAAALLRRARELRRHPRVLVAHAGAHRRHRLHEDRGRTRLHRASTASRCCAPTCPSRSDQLGSLNDHSGPVAEAERYAARVFGADHTFFSVGGQLGEQRDHPPLGGGGRRHRAGRPQLPQVAQLRPEHERRDPGLPAAAAQRARRDRPRARERDRARGDPQEDRGEPAREGRKKPQARARGAHELDLRRALLRRRAHHPAALRRASTASTTTRRGTPTRASTRSTRAATACTAASDRRTTRPSR